MYLTLLDTVHDFTNECGTLYMTKLVFITVNSLFYSFLSRTINHLPLISPTSHTSSSIGLTEDLNLAKNLIAKLYSEQTSLQNEQRAVVRMC